LGLGLKSGLKLRRRFWVRAKVKIRINVNLSDNDVIVAKFETRYWTAIESVFVYVNEDVPGIYVRKRVKRKIGRRRGGSEKRKKKT
jgi:hypothetical protein